MAKEKAAPSPSEKLMLTVRNIRSQAPGWKRSLADAATEAANKAPDFTKLGSLLHDPDGSAPRDSAAQLQRVAVDAGTTPDAALGDHAGLLANALTAAAKNWDGATQAVSSSDAAGTASSAQAAMRALDATMQHALFLTFLQDVRNAHVGESQRINEYTQGWGISTVDIDMLWSWLLADPLEFDGNDLPIALDTVNRCAYRKSDKGWLTGFIDAAPLWGFAVVYGLIVLLFTLLHGAQLTSWPHGPWVWKMLVLVLFVSLGALLHIAARALNVNYDDPMKVFDAGNIIYWLSLRWLAVLKLYVPVGLVAASLWAAGNIPTSFQKLGAATLAGYSADSFLRSVVSRFKTQAAAKTQATSPS